MNKVYVIFGAWLLTWSFAASTYASDQDVSPDGVHLYDFHEHSEVWGRGFNFTFPEGETASSLYDHCASDGPVDGMERGLIDCLKPYINEVYWIDENGDRVEQAMQSVDAPANLRQDLEGPGDLQTVRLKTDDFVIHDLIDCCDNKNAEGYGS